MKTSSGAGGSGGGGHIILKINKPLGVAASGGSGGSGGSGSFFSTDGTGFTKWKQMRPIGLNPEELKLWRLLYSDDYT